MKTVVDNQIARLLSGGPPPFFKQKLLYPIHFKWPTLLTYLGLESIFSSLPLFDDKHPLFVATVSALYDHEDKEVVFHVYDLLFVESLNQIRALEQINAPFLLNAIQEKKKTSPFLEFEKVLAQTLKAYEMACIENAPNTMHDLILYVAWERMCIWMGLLFNYQSTHPKFLQGIDILKSCLIESYQHITQQRKTSPSIYRLLEALFFYEMREENLQKHTEANWALLTKSFPALKKEEELVDFFYIDDAVFAKTEEVNYWTLDPPDLIQSRVSLATYFINQLPILWRGNFEQNFI